MSSFILNIRYLNFLVEVDMVFTATVGTPVVRQPVALKWPLGCMLTCHFSNVPFKN